MDWTRGPTIGRGATATVYLATDNGSGELFAVKSAELSRSTFLRKEQSFLSKLSSPRIVKYLGCSVTAESAVNETPTYNLFLEYFPRGTLFDLISARGRLEEPTIRLYASQILRGLEYLHGSGIAHCDIKSRNVLLGEDGAKIGDLGSARTVGEFGSDRMSFSGTPRFMAPEAARGERQGVEADVWALGCMVVEMGVSAGSLWPETGGCSPTPVSELYRIGFTDCVPEIPKHLSEQGRDFLGRCFERDWRKRVMVRELLEHPFVLGGFGFESISPSSVLVKDFLWDFGEVVRENRTESECSVSSSGRDIIRSLIGNNEPLSSRDFSESDDEDWLIIRSNEDIHHEEEEEIFYELSLFEFDFETQNSVFSDTSLVMSCNNNVKLQNEIKNRLLFFWVQSYYCTFTNLNFMGIFYLFEPKRKKKNSNDLSKLLQLCHKLQNSNPMLMYMIYQYIICLCEKDKLLFEEF